MPISFLSFSFWILMLPMNSSATEFVDTHNYLASLPGRTSSENFMEGFQCGMPFSFFVTTGHCRVHCEFGMCEQDCGWPQIVETNFQAEECAEDKVSVYSSKGHILEFTKADYGLSSNSIALTIIKSVSIFYDAIEKIEVTSARYPETRKIIENGKMKQTVLTTVSVALYPDRTKPESVSIMLSLDLSRSGLDQLMCLGGHTSCRSDQDYFIKRKGLLRD